MFYQGDQTPGGRPIARVLHHMLTLTISTITDDSNIVCGIDVHGEMRVGSNRHGPMLVQRWATVYDAGPSLSQHRIHASRLLGSLVIESDNIHQSCLINY